MIKPNSLITLLGTMLCAQQLALLLLLLGPSTTLVLGYVDTQAIEKCNDLHNANDTDPNSRYLNARCLLQCGIGGEYWWHKINEGLRCPSGMGQFICQDGRCVSSKVIGTIGVQVKSADLVESANAFAEICVQNSSLSGDTPVLDRSKCISCRTPQVYYASKQPAWAFTECQNLQQFVFEDIATVFIEIWDKQEKSIQKYLGRAEISIEKLLIKAKNNQEMALPLQGSRHTGQVNAVISWKAL